MKLSQRVSMRGVSFLNVVADFLESATVEVANREAASSSKSCTWSTVVRRSISRKVASNRAERIVGSTHNIVSGRLVRIRQAAIGLT